MISTVSTGNGFRGCIDYVTQKDGASLVEFRGVTSEATAANEMRAVAYGSERCGSPVYHRQFSLAPGERMTDEQWVAAIDKAEKALSLEGHQRVVVRHTDNDQDHVHVVWNRVNPETGKAQRMSHDYARIEGVCRQIERERGLTVVAGPHSWRQAGAEHPPKAKVATPVEQRHEDRTGRAPFARIVAEAGTKAIAEADSWTDLTDRLQRAGLSLQPYRSGLTVTDGTERAGLSAITTSEWTKAKLEKRFGQTFADFQAGKPTEQKAEARQQPKTEPFRSRNPRAEADELRERYQRYREQIEQQARQQRAGLSPQDAWQQEQARRQREAQARIDSVRRQKAIYRALLGRGFLGKVACRAADESFARRKRQEQAQARQRWESAKADMRQARRDIAKPVSYTVWLGIEATSGNNAARLQLDWIKRQNHQSETPEQREQTALERWRAGAAERQRQQDETRQRPQAMQPSPRMAEERRQVLRERFGGEPTAEPPRPTMQDFLREARASIDDDFAASEREARERNERAVEAIQQALREKAVETAEERRQALRERFGGGPTPEPQKPTREPQNAAQTADRLATMAEYTTAVNAAARALYERHADAYQTNRTEAEGLSRVLAAHAVAAPKEPSGLSALWGQKDYLQKKAAHDQKASELREALGEVTKRRDDAASWLPRDGFRPRNQKYIFEVKLTSSYSYDKGDKLFEEAERQVKTARPDLGRKVEGIRAEDLEQARQRQRESFERQDRERQQRRNNRGPSIGR